MKDIYDLFNIIKQCANLEMKNKLVVKLGTVTNYNPNNYTASVLLQPEGVQTNMLPIFSPWAGDGWGLFCPPSVGDMVEVQFQEGDINSGFVCLRGFNLKIRPLPCPVEEFWLVHKSGASLKLKNNGTIELNSSTSVSIGDVSGSLHKLVTDAFVELFNNHTHSDNNGPPIQQMTNSQLTSIVKGN